jgi:hypothetical protein
MGDKNIDLFNRSISQLVNLLTNKFRDDHIIAEVKRDLRVGIDHLPDKIISSCSSVYEYKKWVSVVEQGGIEEFITKSGYEKLIKSKGDVSSTGMIPNKQITEHTTPVVIGYTSSLFSFMSSSTVFGSFIGSTQPSEISSTSTASDTGFDTEPDTELDAEAQKTLHITNKAIELFRAASELERTEIIKIIKTAFKCYEIHFGIDG